MEVREFADEHLEDAGRLLAGRHRAHRGREPLLPAAYEDPASAQAAIEAAWRMDGALGAVALRAGRAVGYLLAAPDDDEAWGANVWVEFAGQAVAEAELVRDLYAALALRCVEQHGRTRHYVLLPAGDPELLDAWARVGFGLQQAYGIREVPPEAWPDGVRLAEPRDIEQLAAVADVITRAHAASPVFSDRAARALAEPPDPRPELAADLADERIGVLVAEVEGRIAGLFEVMPAELADGVAGHGPLSRPDDACYLAFAATLPEVRGAGAGRALTSATLAWAHEAGYGSIVTDWRVTNLLASRFWPRQGFRESFVRVYRSIP